MSKYTFTEFKRLNHVFFRLDVFPFIALYSLLFSLLIGEIFKLSEQITYSDIFDSFIYLVNFIQNLNSLNSTIIENPNDININGPILNHTYNLIISEPQDTKISEELQLIIDNAPIKYLTAILITMIINLLTFLMTHWNLKFKCTICFSKIHNKSNNYPHDLNKNTSHILVTCSKYPNALCPLKYSTCIENVAKLKDFNTLSSIKSCTITEMSGSKVIQMDAVDYHKHKSEIERIILNNQVSNNMGSIHWTRFINFEKKIFIYDNKIGTFTKLNYPINLATKSYMDKFIHQGGLNTKEMVSSNNLYGINNYEIPRERFLDLFLEQIISPFFLFQIFCVLLWILDEYWQMSLFTLFMLCTLEAQMVLRRLKESEELRNMKRPPCFILVYRDFTWNYISTDHLLPGDIIAISSNSNKDQDSSSNNHNNNAASIAPCDFLLLSGNITVNEAMLTGECTPKIKVAMNFDEDDNQETCPNLSIDQNKNHLIFAGTNIILTRSSLLTENQDFKSTIKKISREHQNFSMSSNQTTEFIKYDNDQMICIGYVLRTGFNTYQGKLIRTISSSTEKISSNSLESLIFLLLLIFCSLLASSYILYNGIRDPHRNKFKLIISCIHIITSVIPPEFPITLSVAVTMAVVHLTKKKIYCTEPFRIPFAGKLQICAFDKTGTLTSDKMIPHGLFGTNLCNKDEKPCILFDNPSSETSICSDLPFSSNLVMGCCNGLSLNGKILVGDPMEKSIKQKSSWRIHHSSENSYHNLTDNSTFTIIRRYPFSPEEQRMTNIGILTNSSKSRGVVISKGSPEMMLNFFKKNDFDPCQYKKVVHECTSKGFRLLALGFKYSNLQDIQNHTIKRDILENDLTFCGFLALYCPIKKHSKAVIEDLNSSNHSCIMITGDNILTAFHVAKNVSIIDNEREILILSPSDDQPISSSSKDDTHLNHHNNNLVWKHPDGTIFNQFDHNINNSLVNITNEFNIGITGQVFETLIENFKDTEILEKFLLLTKVYARMSPKNKQTLIGLYNKMGKMTLMCGDGTNDVGALKHSHVGISLLSSETESTNNDQDNSSQSNKKKKKPSFFEIKKDIETRIRNGERLTRSQIQQEIMKELQGMDEIPKVKLGDASIASPFTYKGDSPNCIIRLVRYGRATLVTVILMYKLMGLNSIVSAFAMSVLAHDGVKFGDFQTTVESIVMSALFFLVLRNKPAKDLVPQRPPNSIFSPMVFLSFLLQALIHLSVIYLGWKISYSLMPLDYSRNIDGPFEPNLINTTIHYNHGSIPTSKCPILLGNDK
ncbi:hypothetical protein OJ253_2823 [Cryptosporidium canis]|uniref:P-type ATPase A domain-containing protein n=1 Tax=Cryptosporidium canis TaxID=195482 RepID=A0A9D5HWE6_9CRYT|nr:hypothetical protein OJ253_2823 [Cryptosporidium canis]